MREQLAANRGTQGRFSVSLSAVVTALIIAALVGFTGWVFTSVGNLERRQAADEAAQGIRDKREDDRDKRLDKCESWLQRIAEAVGAKKP